MKRWFLTLLLGVMILLALAACSQESEDNGAGGEVTNSSTGGGDMASSANGDTAGDNQQVETIIAEVNDDFADALSPMGQLALGTLRLEGGDLAVDAAQAAELLPFWQALQSLSSSQTTAQVELDAVVKQIQATMTAEQVATISEMQLTENSLTASIGSGELGFRGLGRQGNTDDSGSATDLPMPPGGLGGGPGGGPGGGIGGGPGAGLGGGPGSGAGLSEDDIATRRAEFAESGLGDVGERFLTGAVVRLLQTKTGEVPVDRGGLFSTVFDVVANETGLSVEEIQTALAQGKTLAEVIEDNGADIESIRSALTTAFQQLPNAAELDIEQLLDQWLSQ